MKKFIPYVLSTWIMISFSFLTTEKAFPQTNQNWSKMDTARAATTMSDGTSTNVKGITIGRAKALVGVVAGLVSVIVGGLARRRSLRQIGSGKGRNGAIVALILGLIGIILSIIHLSTSVGAVFGSGSGKAGAIFTILLSLIGITLSGLTLSQKKQ